MRATRLLVAMAAMTATAGHAAPLDPEPADRAAIVAIVAAEDAAWSRGDAGAYGANVAPGVIFTNIIGMFAVGKAAFDTQHRTIFAGVYRGTTLHQSIERVTLVRPDVAIVDTVCTVSGMTAMATARPGVPLGDGVLRTRLEQVMVRDDGRWAIAAYHNVPINAAALARQDAPSQGAPPK